MNNGSIFYETAQCNEILDSIERKAKCKQGNYNPDKRYIP